MPWVLERVLSAQQVDPPSASLARPPHTRLPRASQTRSGTTGGCIRMAAISGCTARVSRTGGRCRPCSRLGCPIGSAGPSSPKLVFAPQSVRRALLMPQVNPGYSIAAIRAIKSRLSAVAGGKEPKTRPNNVSAGPPRSTPRLTAPRTSTGTPASTTGRSTPTCTRCR